MKTINRWERKWQRRLGVALLAVPAILVEMAVAAFKAARKGIEVAAEVWRQEEPDR